MNKHHNPFEVKNHTKSYFFGMGIFGLLLFAGLLLALNGQAWSMNDQTRSAIINSMPVAQPDQVAAASSSSPYTGDFVRQLTATVTTTVSLPIVQRDFVNQRQLGQVQMLSGPTTCDGQDCYQLRVSCPYVGQTEDLTIKVGDPISSTFNWDDYLCNRLDWKLLVGCGRIEPGELCGCARCRGHTFPGGIRK